MNHDNVVTDCLQGADRQSSNPLRQTVVVVKDTKIIFSP